MFEMQDTIWMLAETSLGYDIFFRMQERGQAYPYGDYSLNAAVKWIPSGLRTQPNPNPEIPVMML